MNDANRTGTRYTRGAIAFHWTIAVLILLNVTLALVAHDMPEEAHRQLVRNHKAIGMIILVLSVLRIVWRITHTPPPYVETLRAWELALAKVVHSLFYFLIVAIPLTGWALSSANDRPVSFFGWFEITTLPIPVSKTNADVFHEVHELLAWLTMALLVLHVAAALKHQFINRDGTLGRMIPWLRR